MISVLPAPAPSNVIAFDWNRQRSTYSSQWKVVNRHILKAWDHKAEGRLDDAWEAIEKAWLAQQYLFNLRVELHMGSAKHAVDEMKIGLMIAAVSDAVYMARLSERKDAAAVIVHLPRPRRKSKAKCKCDCQCGGSK